MVAASLAAGCGGGGGGRGDDTPGIRFGIWGDTPYTSREAQAVGPLIEQMNDAGLDLSIHVGDLFGALCADAQYLEAAARFDTFAAPLVYTPGDNEWTDCHESDATNHDGLERLAFLRRTMFPTDDSFGRRKIRLERQRPAYPENSRWRVESVLFVTVNVAGSNNNHIADPDAPGERDRRTPDERRVAEAEYQARDAADRSWLHDSFQMAGREGAPAVVVAMQADPGFEVPVAARAARGVDGFDRLLAALVTESVAFGKPVLVVHGDSHRFVQDQPLLDPATGRPVPNVTRVETFGSPDVGWVEITLDPGLATPVRAEPRLVRER
jgi:hypothetical protein